MYTLKQIPSKAQIKKYIRRIVFGKNIFCPNCRYRKVESEKTRYRCKSCRKRFSLLSHTWLSNMKLPYQKFWMVLWCWTTQIPVKQTMSLARLPEKTIRHWFDLFRCHLPQEKPILERIIQLDEAYFKNMALVMGKQKGTRNLAYDIIRNKSVQRYHAFYFLARNVKPRSKLWTDGAGIYQGINNWWPVRHSVDIHKKFQFGKTSEIEGIFGNLRTFIRRMYHHSTNENLEKYVREFCFRFSSPEMFENPRYYLEKSLNLVTTE